LLVLDSDLVACWRDAGDAAAHEAHTRAMKHLVNLPQLNRLAGRELMQTHALGEGVGFAHQGDADGIPGHLARQACGKEQPGIAGADDEDGCVW
jgi:hypothetical protein